MSNVIERDGNVIGYYDDLRQYFREAITNFIGYNNWEEVKEIADIMLELNGWADNDRLLIVDEHNGMGYTINEYNKEG